MKLRTGGSVIDALLEKSLAALQDEHAASHTFEKREVSTPFGSFTIFERTVQTQSEASFVLAHRVLPSTDVTGLRVWPCSFHLLEHLVGTSGTLLAVAGCDPIRVVELGAGTGIVGLGVAATLGTRAMVVVTDPAIPCGDGTSLDLLQRNLDANATLAVARKLLWGDAHDVAALRDELGGASDVVVGSELLYREDSVAALVETVRALEPSMVVLAQQTRPAGMEIEHACISLMQRAGFDATHAPVVATPAVIYTFIKKRSTISRRHSSESE